MAPASRQARRNATSRCGFIIEAVDEDREAIVGPGPAHEVADVAADDEPIAYLYRARRQPQVLTSC